MVLMKIATDVSWAPMPNVMHMMISGTPDFASVPEPITAAFAFITRGQGRDTEILLTRVVKRGLDLPGGHREHGESPLETLVREVDEEVGLTITDPSAVRLLGWLHLHVEAPKPDPYRYPYPDTYMAIGHLHVDHDVEVRGSLLTDEISGYQWISVDEVKQMAETNVWASLVVALP